MATIPTAPHRTAIAFLFFLTFAAYANSLFGVFHFDDITILEDAHLERLSTFLSHLDHTIRPVSKLTFLIDRGLYGENPLGYHLLNLLLHFGSGLVLFTILSIRLSRPDINPSSRYRGFPVIPFWTALLFLTHPLGTETVTYVSGRPTGLATFFYLASFYWFILFRETKQKAKGRLSLYSGSLLCFILSLLSKEIAVTLPGIILLFDRVFYRQDKETFRHFFVRFHLPFWIILTLFLSLGWFHPRYSYLFRRSLEIRSLYESLLTQVNAVAYSFPLFFLPDHLNFDHDLPLYRSVLEWPTPLSLAILLAMLASALFLVRQAPLAGFGLLWFFVTLSPTNSVIPRYDLLSERNLYLPSVGLFLALVSLAVLLVAKVGPAMELRLPGRRVGAYARSGMRALTFLIIPLLMWCTISRNMFYADPVMLWSDAVRKSPNKARPHNNLGHAYYLAGDLDRAIAEFRVALSLDPGHYPAQENLLKAWNLKVRMDKLGQLP